MAKSDTTSPTKDVFASLNLTSITLQNDLAGVVDRLVILTNEGGFDAQLKAFAEAAPASLVSSDFLARQLRDSPPKAVGFDSPRFLFLI